jgi:transcriptional regulator with XRE-family HTH domain
MPGKPNRLEKIRNMKDKSSRGIPLRMAEKLKQIRTSLGLSQKEISIRLEFQDARIRIARSSISGYELGKREPALLVLYAYARLANVSMGVLIDDALELPGTISFTAG